MHTVASLIEELQRLAPLSLAADWDNVGLLLGDRSAEVHRVMTCLTVTPESAAEAIETGAQLVLTHHPVLFRAVKRLTTDAPEGRMLTELIRAGVAVYSAHTAYDDTAGGINEKLAKGLGLTGLEPLRRHEGPRSFKVVVFVPETDLARVSDAMFAAGAGHIGQYSECSFRLAGKGTFFGSDASNPTVGEKGRREEVSEWRLEVICPEAALENVLLAMRRAHSYEEPAFDVYPLRSPQSTTGTGRLGTLAEPLSLEEFARRVKDLLQAGPVQLIGDPSRLVQRVAIVCGAGGELMGEAIRARADVFLTGEMRFHDYLAARAQNLALCLPGHYATERFALEELAGQMRQKWPELEVWASKRECDPVAWI
jgi:dinuclear metal center YbgI/SA1388 family protein